MNTKYPPPIFIHNASFDTYVAAINSLFDCFKADYSKITIFKEIQMLIWSIKWTYSSFESVK